MMNRKKWITWVIIWSCVISMLLGNANVSAQETHPSFPFTVSDAQSMVYSQLYSVAMTATSGALYTFDTSATEADYQLKFFVNAGTSFHAQIYDASGVCRLDRIFTNAQYARFSLTQSTTYYLYINGEIGTAGEVLLSKVADDFGDTMQSAFAMSFNQEYAVSTEIANDEDYLCFTPNGDDASYVLCIEPIIGTTAQYEVWAAGQRIDPYCGTIGTGKIAFELSMRAGQSYYLKITSTQQGHQVIVSVLKNIRHYEVRYHLNGGNNVSGNRTVFVATDSWKLQNPTRQGYTFGGWYLTPKMTGRVYNMSGAGRKSVDLYAKWNAVRITKGSTVKVQKKKKSMKAKTYTLKTTSKSISRNTKSNYYIRVCGYNIDSTGTKIYGGYSTTKKVTADKTKKKSTKKASKKKSRSKKKKASKKTSAKKSTAKKTSKKTASKKKSTAKRTSSASKKKANTKKSTAKKATSKKAVSRKKSTAKKPGSASKKVSTRKSTAKKTSSASKKKATAKKSTAKKATSKKAVSRKKSTAKKTSSANKKKANTKKSVSKKTNSISKKK